MRSLSIFCLMAVAGLAADFEWKGQLAAGQTVEIRNINGEIQAEPASSAQVEVTAVKKAGRHGDVNSVTVQAVPHSGGVTICAVYPTPARAEGPNECAPQGRGRMNTQDNDTQVSFLVRVPAGVRLSANTVNGGINAQHLQSEVDLKTVNGSVRVSTNDIARAKTVNGSIDAELGSARWNGELAFSSVNGKVRVAIPADLSAELNASTVNGDIRTDFPITMRGKIEKRRLQGTIGSGGRELSLKTVNGGIEIARR